ncbi:CHASE domain-containing protein [Zoogloea sp. LCSB751]|uniref:CHASE domain-containing protein n=1 Tax=Zoogloea sp. LCSB751 TaxID=1965277 RepID=UPI0009A529B3|nr:CHASE domain-containing protein [Zoogloea sp. LCSB751]
MLNATPSRLLLVAAGYLALGGLGLLFAIAPGYASPIFPASGLALAAALCFGRSALPGIWLGSASLNLGLAFLSHTLDPRTAVAASLIASGATAQAWLGQALVRRWGGNGWHALEHERTVLHFLLIGGPLACLVSASVGVGSLALLQVMATPQLAFAWWNWFVGDTLGVLTFAPLCLCFLIRSNHLWQARRRQITAPMLLTLLFVGIAIYATARWEQNGQQHRLEADAERVQKRIEDRLQIHREALLSLRRLLEVTPDIGPAQFEAFTLSTLQDNPDLAAFSFNAYVPVAERATFERDMSRRLNERQFAIKERSEDGSLVPAAARDAYVPVTYISPALPNRLALGFDLASEKVRREALDRGQRAYSGIAVSAPLRLVQEQTGKVTVLALAPVHWHGERPVRSDPLRGFAIAIINMDQLVAVATGDGLPPGLHLELTDPAAGPGPQRLDRATEPMDARTTRAMWSGQIRAGDRTWTLQVFADDRYLALNRPWIAWGVGVVGLLFATLLQTLMLGMTGRTAIIERRVERQTHDIAAANRELASHRDHLEELVAARTADLSIAKEAAEAANRAKSSFLANMSHELRPPMNAIIGLTHILSRKNADPDQRERLGRISRAAGHLLQLLNDVLELSRIDAERLPIEEVPFQLKAVIANVDSLVGTDVAARGLQLRLELAPELADLPLLGDPLRLQQVLLNIIGNAIKFTHQGSVTLAVSGASEGSDGLLLRFEVRDTGIGIPADALHRIFQPFEQADSSTTRRFGGTGLGLTICQRLVRLMGGEIGVDSIPGEGSVFWFTCRVARSARPLPNPEHPLPSSTDAEQKLRAEHRHRRILLAEDDWVNQEVSLELLREILGLPTDLAENGAEALRLAEQTPYDLILMDIQMPVMDGLAATRAIRALPAHGRTPILAMTANAFEEDRLACRAAGMDDFIPKPADPDLLFRTLLHWLEKRAKTPAAITSHTLGG